MLGHKLWQVFSPRFDTYVTFRRSASTYTGNELFDHLRAISNVSAVDFETVSRAVDQVRPDVVVNGIGIVKQDAAAKDPVASISVNALFPHRLAAVCGEVGARLIHLSTDCVFSGQKGNYSETDSPDPEDLYGRSKLLGELIGENCLTVRTSMIGHELEGSHGLLEWLLSQNGGRVRGFKRAVFSGFVTPALAQTLARIIIEYPRLSGIRHVASQAINKFDLLSLVKNVYELNVEIEPDETVACDRSLDGSLFEHETGIRAPSWPEMIVQMHEDARVYDQLRRVDAAR